MEFANARKFRRLNVTWRSLLDDFVTTNFGTRAPRPRAPRSKILAMPLPDRTPKLNQSDLLYGSNSPAEKSEHGYAFSSQLSLTVYGVLVTKPTRRYTVCVYTYVYKR